MIQLLRQLSTLLVVTFVAIGLTVSVGNASMALECELIDVTSAIEQSVSQNDHSVHSSRISAPVDTNIADDHSTYYGAGSDAQAEHCTAHACPAAFHLGSGDSVQAVSLSQSMAAARIDPLVQLTVPEGLRRPPRG